MPRYLVVRTFDIEAKDIPRLSRAFRERVSEFPDATWEHSHVTVDDEGLVRTFCVYGAPDEQAVRRHASLLGVHEIEMIQEIAGDVSPADFPHDPS